MDSAEREALAERERAANLKDELDRTTASLKKEIRELQKQLETVKKVENKVNSCQAFFTKTPSQCLLLPPELMMLDFDFDFDYLFSC